MASGYDDLTAKVREAVEASLAQLCDQGVLEDLAGYALCTDDDLVTLYHVAVTRSTLHARPDYGDLWLMPVDWELAADDRLFAPAYARLVASSESASDHVAHVRCTFEALVQALLAIRSRALLPVAATLIVTSTDPGPMLQELADDAILRL